MVSVRGSDTVVCLASGPSLTREDAERARLYRTIVVNTTFRMAPWADYLFAGDFGWWNHYRKEVKKVFLGECWTGNERAAKLFGLNHIRQKNQRGLSREKGLIHSGGNSGYGAMELAYQFGARRIVLLGYDMQWTDGKSHWHGDHERLSNRNCFPRWIESIESTAEELSKIGVEVLNATRQTAIKKIKQITANDL